MKFVVNKNMHLLPKKKQKIHMESLEGYLLPSKKNVFNIKGQSIKDLRVTNKKMAHPFVYKQVSKRYNHLIKVLMELFVSGDETGEAFHIILNEIEKFRQEIKNKYRKYLKKKELEFMAKTLEKYQKEALKNLAIIQEKSLEERLGRSK